MRTFLLAFSTAVVANLVGVLLFFQPLAEGDTSFVAVHPLLGFLVYVGSCAALFTWGARRMQSPYASAFLVAASQVALVVDLMLRGDRGAVTTIAGTVLLAATWWLVAAVASRWGESPTSPGEPPRG
ncbi:MAG: hypothetical protein AAGA81_00390 [Acidobacteriota bacterium]